MKVLLLNGSPHKEGCTYTALKEMEKEFLKEGIETEIFYIGTDAIAPCRACGACNKLKISKYYLWQLQLLEELFCVFAALVLVLDPPHWLKLHTFAKLSTTLG